MTIAEELCAVRMIGSDLKFKKFAGEKIADLERQRRFREVQWCVEQTRGVLEKWRNVKLKLQNRLASASGAVERLKGLTANV